MANFLRLLADIALLPVSGCIFPGNRNRSDDWHGSEVSPQAGGIKEGTEQMAVAVQKIKIAFVPDNREFPIFLHVKGKP